VQAVACDVHVSIGASAARGVVVPSHRIHRSAAPWVRVAVMYGLALTAAACANRDRGDKGDSSPDAGAPPTAPPTAPPNTSNVAPPTNPACPQSAASPQEVEPPPTTSYIYPRVHVTPFYQWENNQGYCGEVTLMQAGMNNGQWMSQADARLVCGGQANGVDGPTGAAMYQSGPDQAAGKTYCEAYPSSGGDQNTQLLLEDAAPDNPTRCLTNARLAFKTYDYESGDNVGVSGYQHYMAWVKAEMIAGHQVTIGVLDDNTEPVYNHIVTVVAIGTNHDPSDASYYDDDVIYIEDHGATTITNGASAPAIPPGVGGTTGCTPYVFGYAFGTFGMTDAQYLAQGGGGDTGVTYAEVIPGLADQNSCWGGNGLGSGPPETGHNYAFSVSGPADDDSVTLPVALRIASSSINGVANPADPLAGYNYENPKIGDNDNGDGCTNTVPEPMLVTLEVTVSGLVPGTQYNLYEYDAGLVTGVGAAAGLAVPTAGFNANAAMATVATSFVATSTTYSTSVSKSSQTSVVFRAVAVSAP
jgi:hypothetical protein